MNCDVGEERKENQKKVNKIENYKKEEDEKMEENEVLNEVLENTEDQIKN